ncbi:MAG: hypothetical protein KIT25_03420 [Enhydrobacter sp.]|nr:MAG: hypothetical protein KIT25_03420 [Enhydrobacter sp.]
MDGTITEVVGLIARGRRLVYRVEFSMIGDEPLAAHLTADELKPMRQKHHAAG